MCRLSATPYKRPALVSDGDEPSCVAALPTACPCSNDHVGLTSLSIQKVSFDAVQIQKLRRVALDEHLLVTLGLAVGDRVTVELDVESEAIVLRKVHAQKVRAVASSPSDDHAH